MFIAEIKCNNCNFEIVFFNGNLTILRIGTTEFNKLIEVVTSSDILEVLEAKNCQNIKIQIGAGDIIPYTEHHNISVQYYRYKDSLTKDILEADLIISHAGAGTCLEVLELKKPLIAVINDSLMNNHQQELAEKLSSKGHSICCTCDSLADSLNLIEFSKLKPFTYDNDKKCALFIESLFSIKNN